MARLVDGLETLRAEFNVVNPKRDRSSDGWIGDDRHAATVSDHNPDALGWVRAIDVDVDGVPMGRIVVWLVARCRAGKETRLQYIIYRGTIWSRSWGWKARKYKGANPHTKHCHISARNADVAYDGRPWGLAAAFGPHGAESATTPKPNPVKVSGKGKYPAGSRLLLLHVPTLGGDDVRYVQRWIDACKPVTGVYDAHTAAGVRAYQDMRGITSDGRVGPITWRHLGVRWTGASP